MNYSRDVLSENTYIVELANVSSKKTKKTCMTSLDKSNLVEKVAESYLRFETRYAAPIRKRI